MTALWVIVLCGALSIVYAIWATSSVLKSDAGNPRMQEIAARAAAGLGWTPKYKNPPNPIRIERAH